MTTDPVNRHHIDTTVPSADSHEQDTRTGTADITPAPVSSPVSTGPPDRPPVYPQHPNSGTWHPVSASGTPVSVREVEAAASTAPAAHTSAHAASRSSVHSPSETAAAGVVLRDLADEYALLLCSYDPEAAARTGMPGGAILPDYSPAGLAERLNAERSLRHRVAAVDRSAGPDELLRRHLLERLETSIQFISAGEEGGNLGFLSSPFQRIARQLHRPPEAPDRVGSEEADLAEAEAKWEDAWDLHRTRLEALPAALEGLAASLAASAEAGAIAPRSQVDVVAGQARDLASRRTRALPEDLPATLHVQLQEADVAARRAALDFASHLRTTFSPRAPQAEGIGPQRHALWMRRILGTRVDPEETYTWATGELERVIAEQDAIAVDILGPGADADDLNRHLRADPTRALSPGDYATWAQEVADEAWDAVVGRVLDPPDGLGRPWVRLGEPGAGAVHYEEPRGTGGERRPGMVLRSLSDGERLVWPWMERTTVLHESVPGHHVHVGAHATSTRLTAWQRYLGSVPGCDEGWGLYAESLADELGLMPTPEDRFGRLAARRWRLARVLVDLGVHSRLPVPDDVAVLPGASREWNRATVTAVLRHHTVISEGRLRFEVSRHLGWPSQPLAYAVGERVWQAGRRSARAQARTEGGELDLRAFHNRGIDLGSVGLDLLASALH